MASSKSRFPILPECPAFVISSKQSRGPVEAFRRYLVGTGSCHRTGHTIQVIFPSPDIEVLGQAFPDKLTPERSGAEEVGHELEHVVFTWIDLGHTQIRVLRTAVNEYGVSTHKVENVNKCFLCAFNEAVGKNHHQH